MRILILAVNGSLPLPMADLLRARAPDLGGDAAEELVAGVSESVI